MNVTGSFYRVLCKSPKKELRFSPSRGHEWRGVGVAHHLNADACINIGGDSKCLFSGGFSNLRLMFLLASPAFLPQEPFDRLEMGQGYNSEKDK